MKSATQILNTWRALLLILALMLSVTLTGCEEEEDELSGPFGPGAGDGPIVTPSALQDLKASDDTTVFGAFQYDDGYWDDKSAAENITDPELYLFWDDPTFPSLILSFTRISGRPDTPCRYEAAIIARDYGYTILASGDRTNSQGLDFHQVNLSKGTDYYHLYCATVSGNLGVKITGISLGANKLGNEQVHYILNSVSP